MDDGRNYSDIIKSALHIDQSTARAQRLKRLLGRDFEYEPRRRKDIDMIFLVVRAEEGQQIKPLLAFYYAANIPVYATSQIYSSQQSIAATSATKNSDLDGIRFTTLPWILSPEQRDPHLMAEELNIPSNYERLYAMGIDAYKLHDRLQQLAQMPNAVVYGATGKLTLDNNDRIVRQQPWAIMVRGQAQPLNVLTDASLGQDEP